jgi:hypothetical protein
MGYLFAADHTAMAAETQAECLLELEQLDAVKTATRAKVLGAFTAAQGYSADADYSPRSWLIHRTRITKGAAALHLAWARRAAAHPRIAAALAEGVFSESYARKVCEWSNKLPADCQDAADAILVAAARTGADLQDLVQLAAEMYTRSLPEPDDDRPDESFEDRRVTVETTFDGAGVIGGDLTPECAAVVTAVLESLSAPMGAEDPRTKEQRYHDGLQEAMRRLVASGLLPERAGQPVKVWVHVSLAELRAMDDGSVLAGQWISEMAIRWATHRAADSDGAGSDGGAWLNGKAVKAVACDAVLTPVVTGDVDPEVLDDLVRLCVQLERIEHGTGPADGEDIHIQPEGSPSRETLRQAIIGKTIILLMHSGSMLDLQEPLRLSSLSADADS